VETSGKAKACSGAYTRSGSEGRIVAETHVTAITSSAPIHARA